MFCLPYYTVLRAEHQSLMSFLYKVHAMRRLLFPMSDAVSMAKIVTALPCHWLKLSNEILLIGVSSVPLGSMQKLSALRH